MLFEHRTYWLPKDVQDPNAYEDASHVDPARGVAAICDGVASTLFSGKWASILAQAVVAERPSVSDREQLEAWLKKYREVWSASVDESSLAWHQKPKMLEGAASTLLWIEFSSEGAAGKVAKPLRLRCYAIGDCCLFHIRKGQVLQSFPMQESAAFEANPQVIRSVFKREDAVAFQAMETQCKPGDLVLLCTDAVAAWTMKQLEDGADVDWAAYWQMSGEDWQRWILGLRQNGLIRYDDSTAVLLRMPGGRPLKVGQTDESMIDKAEDSLRNALGSLRGKVRKGLRGLSDSKWLKDE
jgi:serine/threonine protein phosphatase PrpC